MDAALAGLIGALGGATIGLVGALKINADQRDAAARAEKQRAFAAYLGALYPAVAELREMPPNKEPDLLERAVDRISSEQATWVRTRRGIAEMGAPFLGRIDRLSAATALVQVLDMPKQLMSAFDEANDYVQRLGEDRTPKRLAEWSAIYSRLHAANELLRADTRSLAHPFRLSST